MDYAQKLRDGRWQKKRLEIFSRDGFRCVVCGESNNIQAHHNWYLGQKEPWEYQNSQLVTLCNCHHEEITKVQEQIKLVLSELKPAQMDVALELLRKTFILNAETFGSVKLTANRSDEEPHRIVRLRQCVEFLRRIDSMSLMSLVALHDHKGCLEATWSQFATDDCLLDLNQAWEACGEYEVKHFFLELE